jgi:hypothetical protein
MTLKSAEISSKTSSKLSSHNDIGNHWRRSPGGSANGCSNRVAASPNALGIGLELLNGYSIDVSKLRR